MTQEWLLANLAAWSAQILAAVAAGMLAVMGLKHPRARLVFWQGLLALCLMAPLLQPWRKPAAADGAAVTATSVILGAGMPVQPARPWPSAAELAIGIWAGGAVARLAWLALGMWRLHRYPRREIESPVETGVERARWYLCEAGVGPVSYGRTILLPAHFDELDADVRRAIALHELEHVMRRDWLFVLAEEFARAALWFHPAIWWALGQVHLAREQVVDLAVVERTRNRDRYLDALLAVAEANLAPATLFLKKSHLARRVAAILKEARMSYRRVTAALVAAAASVAITAWMFPLRAPAQEPDDPGIEVKTGPFKLLHRAPVSAPRGANVQGDVIVEVAVNAKGEVTDARVISGPEELRKAALESVLQWHFSPEPPLAPRFEVGIRFGAPPGRAERILPRTLGPSVPVGLTLSGVQFGVVPQELRQKVEERLAVHSGDAITDETLSRIQSALREIDDHLIASIRPGRDGKAILQITLAQPRIVQQGSSATLEPAGSPQRIRVGGNVQAMNLIHKVTPAYPTLAKQARIQGTVRFNVTIGNDGTVKNVELVAGHPLLAPAAEEAVRQWVYRPTLLNGDPVEVLTQVDVNFTLLEPDAAQPQ